MTRFRNLLPLAAAALAVSLGAPGRADAGFKIRISEDGGSSYVLNVADNGVGDLSPTTGAITASYIDSNVAFSITIAQSKPLFGNSAGNSAIDLTVTGTFASSFSGGFGGTITVDVTDTGFSAPGNFGGPGTLEAKVVNNNNPTTSNATFTGYLNSGSGGNNEYGGIDALGGTVFTAGPANLTSGFGTAVASTNVPVVSGPYSMSSRLVFTGGAGSGFAYDGLVTFAPAPASLLMAAAGMPVLGLGAWFRRLKARAQA